MKRASILLTCILLLVSCSQATTNDSHLSKSTQVKTMFEKLVTKIDEQSSKEHNPMEEISFEWRDNNTSKRIMIKGYRVFYPEYSDTTPQILINQTLLQEGFILGSQSDGGPGMADHFRKEDMVCTVQSMNTGARELMEENERIGNDAPYSMKDYNHRGLETNFMCGELGRVL